MKYQKAKMIAKNLPTGSYAAGCPAKDRGNDRCLGGQNFSGCTYCERTK